MQHLKPVQMQIKERLAIIVVRGGEELAPEARRLLQAGTHLPVMVGGDLPHLPESQSGQGVRNHRGHGEQLARDAVIQARGVPGNQEGVVRHLDCGCAGQEARMTRGADAPGTLFSSPLPPVPVLETEVDQQKRTETGAFPGRGVQGYPQLPILDHHFVGRVNCALSGGARRQALEESAIELVYQVQTGVADPWERR